MPYSAYTLSFVDVLTLRTVAVWRDTQIVEWMLACVTAGSATPGLSAGLGRLAAPAALPGAVVAGVAIVEVVVGRDVVDVVAGGAVVLVVDIDDDVVGPVLVDVGAVERVL